jgi:hypothetical protein
LCADESREKDCEAADLGHDQREHPRVQGAGWMFELVGGVPLATWFSEVAICRYFQTPRTSARRKMSPAASSVSRVSMPKTTEIRY